MLRQQTTNELKICFHVFLHVARRRRGFQLRPAAEPGFDDGANDLRKINFPLAEQVRIVLQVKFADPVFAKDRKSTRLNSSHSQISYAVFCLKKKKKKKTKL